MKIITELMAVCLETVTEHYANKAKAQNIRATEAEIQKATTDNWPQIQQEIMTLYQKSFNELAKTV